MANPHSGDRAARLRAAALPLGAGALLLLHARHLEHVCDDAYISFRYAQNAARGLGLVFNPGERVMGYSNPLWVLLLVPFEQAGVPAPVAAALLGLLASWATLWVLDAHLRRRGASLLGRAAAQLLLVANGTFALWSVAGLEGPLFALLLTLGALAAAALPRSATAHAALRAGAPFALLALTRPDGVLYGVAAAAWALGARRLRTGRAIALALPCLAAALALAAWSWAYYGDPLPNTYYAKRQPLSALLLLRGALYAWQFVRAYLGVPVLVVALWLLLARKAAAPASQLALALLGTFAAFFLGIGGDALVYHRMWLWTLPLLALLGAEAVERLSARGPGGALGARAALLLFAGGSLANSVAGADLGYLRGDDRLVRELHLVAGALRALGPEVHVAANMIGVLGYASGQPILDMLGLADRHVARAPGKLLAVPGHESHDGAYVLSRRPEVILPYQPRVLAAPASLAEVAARGYAPDLDLYRDPRFARDYVLVNLGLPGNRYTPAFLRRDFAARVAAAFVPARRD